LVTVHPSAVEEDAINVHNEFVRFDIHWSLTLATYRYKSLLFTFVQHQHSTVIELYCTWLSKFPKKLLLRVTFPLTFY